AEWKARRIGETRIRLHEPRKRLEAEVEVCAGSVAMPEPWGWAVVWCGFDDDPDWWRGWFDDDHSGWCSDGGDSWRGGRGLCGDDDAVADAVGLEADDGIGAQVEAASAGVDHVDDHIFADSALA